MRLVADRRRRIGGVLADDDLEALASTGGAPSDVPDEDGIVGESADGVAFIQCTRGAKHDHALLETKEKSAVPPPLRLNTQQHARAHTGMREMDRQI